MTVTASGQTLVDAQVDLDSGWNLVGVAAEALLAQIRELPGSAW